MKTTIDIPKLLYKRGQFLAIERGQTLTQIVLTSLERELDPSAAHPTKPSPTWGNRKLLPAFARLQAAGACTPKPGERDITELISDISEDREDRPL